MSTLTVPPNIANRIRAKAKAEGLTISDLLKQLLRSYDATPRTIKRRSSRVMRNDAVTQRLNKIYAKEDSSLDPVIAKIQAKALREEW
ncbi:MAG: hypothetical protein HZC38_01275 [Chloroflexi bacterium]|nr:hypothetical protein [Chloroflexota bacterium]MBI5082886.1 hypothetical protein [Chloroflexota bacterium]MBI5712048.1 hypothetical protein [Chloroflexota bacterium]